MSFIESAVQNAYKEITKVDLKPIELDFTDEFVEVLKEFQLENSPLEIQDHFLKLYYFLRKHYIDIVGWKKVNLEIRYFFRRVNETVAAKFWINAKNVFNTNFIPLPQPNDSMELFENIRRIVASSQPIIFKRERIETVLTKFEFEFNLEEKQPFLASLYDAIQQYMVGKSFHIIKIDHLQYRERYYFERENEKVIIDFEYDGQGVFGRVIPQDSLSNSQDLMTELKTLVNQIKSSYHVI